MADKYIKAYYWGAGETWSTQFLTSKDIVAERNRLREAASKALAEESNMEIRHILYYRDDRRNDDSIWKAHFYINLIGMTDKEFYERTHDLGNGFIGAVHRHE